MSSLNSDHTNGTHFNLDNTHEPFPWELNWNTKTHWPENVSEFNILDYPLPLDHIHDNDRLDDENFQKKSLANMDIQNGTHKSKKRKDKSDSDTDGSDSSKSAKSDQRKHPNSKLIQKDLQKQQLEHHTWIQHKKLFHKQEHLFAKVKDVCVYGTVDFLGPKLEYRKNETNANNNHSNEKQTNTEINHGSDILTLGPLLQARQEDITEVYQGYWCDGKFFQTGQWVSVIENFSSSNTRKIYGIIRYFFRDCNALCCAHLTQIQPTVEENPNWTAQMFKVGTDKVVLANCITEILKLNRYRH